MMTLLDPRFLLVMILTHALAFWSGTLGEFKKAETQITQAVNTQTAQMEKKQETIAAEAETQQILVQDRVHIVYRDRADQRKKEIPHEVIARQDAGCAIPVGFVSLWNSGNRAELPPAAAGADESPSGVVLSDVTAQHDRETELCRANTEQLKGLIDYNRRIAEVKR